MATKNYFTIYIVILIELFAILLQLEHLKRSVLFFEAIAVLGFAFFTLIILHGIRKQWKWIYLIGILFFSFNMLNSLLLYFFTQRTKLLFISVLVGILGIYLCTISPSKKRKKIPKDRNMLPVPMPPSKIIEEKPRKRRKFVGSAYGKEFHNLRCNVTKIMKRKNKVFFNTEAEAKKAQFKPHKCIK